MKGGIDRLAELFAARAAAHGELTPEFENDAVTAFSSDGTPVNFSYRAVADTVIAWTAAGDAPAADDEKRLSEALAANRYGTGTRGLTLAIMPEDLGFGRRLVVQDRRSAAFFDSVETLDAYIEEVAAVAREYGTVEEKADDDSHSVRINA